MNNLLIVQSAVTIAAHLRVHGHANFPPGSVAVAECQQLDLEVKLPIHGPLEAAIAERFPDLIHFEFVPKRLQFSVWAGGTPDLRPTTFGLMAVVANLIAPVFSEFYESYKDWIHSQSGRRTNNWPPEWRFARVIRNAISHGGEIVIDNPTEPPASWYGLTYSRADNGRRPIGVRDADLGIGDLLVLMFEMSDVLDALGCPT
jgi:hypothetical protein